MRPWPTFHHDGSVTIYGDVVGTKLCMFPSGFEFWCNCGLSTERVALVRTLRGAVRDHIETQAHLDRMAGVTS